MFWIDLLISPRCRTAVCPCFLSIPFGLFCCVGFFFRWPWLSPSLLLSEFPGFWIGYSWDSSSWHIGTRGVLCCFVLLFFFLLWPVLMLCFPLIFNLFPHYWIILNCWMSSGMFLPLYQRSSLRHDLGCNPCTAPAFLLQQDGDTPMSVEG